MIVLQKEEKLPEPVDSPVADSPPPEIEETPSCPTPPPPEGDNEEEEEEDDDCLKSSVLPNENLSSLVSPGGSTFDYLYEFSETRKVLEEFFKCPPPAEKKENNVDSSPFQVRPRFFESFLELSL